MAYKKMLLNKPVRVVAKFLDVQPGKLWDDPNTGKTKPLPAQLIINGAIDGEDAKLQIPGPAWAGVKCLRESGIVAADTQVPDDLADKMNIPLLKKIFVLENQQIPGKNYGNLVVVEGGAPKPQPTTNGKQAVSIGAPVKGLDYDDADAPEWVTEQQHDERRFVQETTAPTEEDGDTALVTRMVHLQRLCARAWFAQVAPVYPNDLGLSPEAATAGIATLLIAVQKEAGK